MNDIKKNQTEYKAGFIAILGVPNVGKSTLMNKMAGQKVSITSKKPQTTRNRILGIVTRDRFQSIFIDTPGIHKARGKLNIKIVDSAFSAISDSDIILFIADASRFDSESEKILLSRLNNIKKPVILTLNKIDLIKKKVIARLLETYRDIYLFENIIPISAKHGIGIELLFSEIQRLLPESPMLFPEDALTDMPQRFIAAEIIREKIFRSTGEEIPYAVAVTIESFKEYPALNKIYAVINVERNSQKGIIIGKNGTKLVKIGTEARKELEKMTGKRVYLKLFVRLQKNWSNDTKALLKFGY